MSFSTDIKEELVRLRTNKPSLKAAQLAGLTHTAGAIRLGHALKVDYTTETHAVGKHIATLATSLYPLEAILALRETASRTARTIVVTLSGEGCKQLLSDCGVLSRSKNGVVFRQTIPDAYLESDELRRAFLRGAFLGAGSCSNPSRAYHLEIVCRSKAFADTLCQVMETFDCPTKILFRKGKFVVYLKEGDQIAAFLALIGASKAMLAFEDVRAEKDLRNYINRTNNCETANIGKTVNAAADQLMAIRTIDRLQGLEKLSPALREAAELRLNNPDASLIELAGMAGVGKSGIYHRFSKLAQIAHDLTVQKGVPL